jgi:hypothetical protein
VHSPVCCFFGGGRSISVDIIKAASEAALVFRTDARKARLAPDILLLAKWDVCCGGSTVSWRVKNLASEEFPAF